MLGNSARDLSLDLPIEIEMAPEEIRDVGHYRHRTRL